MRHQLWDKLRTSAIRSGCVKTHSFKSLSNISDLCGKNVVEVDRIPCNFCSGGSRAFNEGHSLIFVVIEDYSGCNRDRRCG